MTQPVIAIIEEMIRPTKERIHLRFDQIDPPEKLEIFTGN
jgi:hypothetical protein